jgi:beta-ketoacyl-acyl-carrier-protein synthase II
MRRVVVTGLGAITPLGNDVGSFFNALVAGRSGIRRLEQGSTDSCLPRTVAPAAQDLGRSFSKLKLISLDRVAQLALLAARQAVTQAGIDLTDDMAERAGIFWGTGMGGAVTLESAYTELLVNHASRLRPTTIVTAMSNAAAGQISIEFGIKGPSYTYSSACSSSAVAIGEAFRSIRFGLVEIAITGGAEALLTRGVIKAWESLQTLAKTDAKYPETSCRPFALDRSGFVLGEGAGALILESEQSAKKRGAKIHAEIVGYGNTTDGSNITQPDLSGQARAMVQALAEARLSPEQVDHLNAHGTGTKAGDSCETSAIKRVFGEHAWRLPVSATKALHGHLMGATGAVEMVATLEALRTRIAPPTAHLFHPDPECDLDYVSSGARELPRMHVAMSNSFGFGGSNAVIVAKRYHP